MKRITMMLMAVILAAIHLLAQPHSVKVSLLTASPGLEVYELEGHSGLRLQTADGLDVVANWGVYDFAAPGFIYRFVKGETDYMCAVQPTDHFIASYVDRGRQVTEQEIQLDSLQSAQLIALLEANLLPQNRIYRYNYVLDNCATRPLQLLETVAGRPLVEQGGEVTTFRREMQHYHSLYSWYQFGIDLALGSGIDQPIQRREACFAPVRLCQEIAADSLVGKTYTYGTPSAHPSPTFALFTPMSLALLLLALSVLLLLNPLGRLAKLFDTVLFTLFALAGCVITFLVFISSHYATSPNLLLLWLNPLCILGAILPWIKNAKNLTNSYFLLNFALIITLAIAAPIVGQSMNSAFWPLMAADAVRSFANTNIWLRRRKN